jgi:hypothetical protein
MFRKSAVLVSLVLTALVLLSGCSRIGKSQAATPEPEVAQQSLEPVKLASRASEASRAKATHKAPKLVEAKPVEAKPESELERYVRFLHSTEIRLSSLDLLGQYKVNVIAGDKQYKGKKLLVTGIVRRVDKDIRGKGHVTVFAGVSQLDNINCYFEKKELAELEELIPDNGIMIYGECKGYLLGSVVLERCSVALVGDSITAMADKTKAYAKATSKR